MQENLKAVGQLYQDTLLYLNTQQQAYSERVSYKAFVTLVIETKKVELENKISLCFNNEGQIVSDITAIKKQMSHLKTSTRRELGLLV